MSGELLLPGDSESASFNDETSPNSRVTSGQKVSIEGQVIPGSPLDWYYRILQSCQSVVGEVKSAEAWNRFQSLDAATRGTVWKDLSKVRIHITDPRPYRESTHDILRRAWRNVDAPALLRQRALEGDAQAQAFISRLESLAADSIWRDSFAARLHSLTKFLRNNWRMVTAREASELDSFVGVEQLGSKSTVRKAVSLSAKSASTFHEALDCFLELNETFEVFPSPLVRLRMESRVLQPHTFDKETDPRPIELLERTRSAILGNLRRYEGSERMPKKYLEAPSEGSYFLQAADIAAGFASRTWEESGFVAVVSNFEYVTYNGKRLSVSDAEEEVRRPYWRNSK